MKRVLAILLVFTHLLTTTGFGMNVHHCGGKTSYHLFGIDFNKTCKCNHEEDNHPSKCCHDKKIEIKASDNIKNTVREFELKKVFLPEGKIFYTVSSLFSQLYTTSQLVPSISNPPPLLRAPLLLFIQVFRI